MISQNKAKGFTLVELLIVIVVIAILAAISIVAYNGVTQKARDDERATNARNVINAIASYHAENGQYPSGAADLKNKLAGFNTVKVGSAVLDTLKHVAPGSGAEAKTLQVFVCKKADSVVGIKLAHWKEDGNTRPEQTTGEVTGDGVECTPTA